MPKTNFPDGITSQGTAVEYGSASIVDGAGTISTGISTVAGFALGIGGGVFGTAAVDEAYACGGSISSGDIVVTVTAYGGTAMGGTATVYWTAWGS